MSVSPLPPARRGGGSKWVVVVVAAQREYRETQFTSNNALSRCTRFASVVRTLKNILVKKKWFFFLFLFLKKCKSEVKFSLNVLINKQFVFFFFQRTNKKMGDLRILDPRLDPRFAGAADLSKHRPWPPMYRSNSRGPSICYRPMPLEHLTQWMSPHHQHPDYNYVPARALNGNSSGNKGRDYYYLTPMYRNAMPPPPQPMSPMQMPLAPARMMLMEQPRPPRGGGRAKSSGGHQGRNNSVPPCTCTIGRTRSLEDVRSEVSEWEECQDENGNHLRYSPKNNGNSNNKVSARKSMENLLDVEVVDGGCALLLNNNNGINKHLRNGKCEAAKNGRRRGSYMVRDNALYKR